MKLINCLKKRDISLFVDPIRFLDGKEISRHVCWSFHKLQEFAIQGGHLMLFL
jgi:hypothetical protein